MRAGLEEKGKGMAETAIASKVKVPAGRGVVARPVLPVAEEEYPTTRCRKRTALDTENR